MARKDRTQNIPFNELDIDNVLSRARDFYLEIPQISRLIDIISNFSSNLESVRADVSDEIWSSSMRYDCNYLELLDGFERLVLKGDLPLVRPLGLELAESLEHIKHRSPEYILQEVESCSNFSKPYDADDPDTVTLVSQELSQFDSVKGLIGKYHVFNPVYLWCLDEILKTDLSPNERQGIGLERETVDKMNSISVFACGSYGELLLYIDEFNRIMKCIDGIEIGTAFVYEADHLEFLKASASLVSKVADSGDNVTVGRLYDHVPEYMRRGFGDEERYRKALAILD